MTRPRIIALGARKGGVGKTALTREFGARLAHRYRVLLVNADAQDTLTLVLGMKAEPGLSQVLLTDDPVDEWKRPVPREAWATSDAQGELYVLPGDESTAATGIQLIIDKAPTLLLREKLMDALAQDVVDFILMDTSPSIMPFAPWLYAAADAAIIPTGGAMEGIDGIGKTERGFQMVSRFTRGRHEVEVIGIVPTQIMSRTNIHRKNWSDMMRVWRGKVWPMIDLRITWQYASQFRQTLQVYAPGSDADVEAESAFQVLTEIIAPELEAEYVAG